jgi:hypothetical protein
MDVEMSSVRCSYYYMGFFNCVTLQVSRRYLPSALPAWVGVIISAPLSNGRWSLFLSTGLPVARNTHARQCTIRTASCHAVILRAIFHT